MIFIYLEKVGFIEKMILIIFFEVFFRFFNKILITKILYEKESGRKVLRIVFLPYNSNPFSHLKFRELHELAEIEIAKL